MKTAVIVGNGESRKGFSLAELKSQGTMFGCNALYRDFEPDFLVAIDPAMIKEIRESSFPEEKLIIPDINDQFEPAEFNPNRPRSNAGMNAMQEAIAMGYEHLVCVGFDFLSETTWGSNLYEGTACYGPDTRASYEDTIKRVEYFAWFARQNPKIQFTFLFNNSDGKLELRSLKGDLGNVKGMFLNENSKTSNV